MFDSHVHTNFSTDSKMDIKDAIAAAEKLGIGIVITEHQDLKYPKKNTFVFDIDKYFEDFSKYRSDRVLLGIEMGLREICRKENEDTLKKGYPFDFVLGSIHYAGDFEIARSSLFDNRSKKETYEFYFKKMLQNIDENPYIDSLAHIDYISRYSPYDNTEINYSEFSDYIDAVLESIIDKGIALEINTRRIDKDSSFNSLMGIYKRFSELKGKYVTIGSDSHRSTAVGKDFNKAIKIAESCNLKPVYFKERKMEYCK